MASYEDTHSIIVPAANANFTAHTYTHIYVGANATFTVNGVVVTAVGGSTLNLKVRSISATANVYLLGENIDVSFDNPNIYTLTT